MEVGVPRLILFIASSHVQMNNKRSPNLFLPPILFLIQQNLVAVVYEANLQVKRMARFREGFLALLDPYCMGLRPLAHCKRRKPASPRDHPIELPHRPIRADLLCSLVL
ncbi:unnamed protein product [Musa hybrid cultivar]